MKLSIFAILLFLVINTLAVAQREQKTFTTPEEARKLSEDATVLFYNGEIDKMVDMLTPYWPIPLEEIESFRQQTKESKAVISQRFGAPFRYSKVKESTIQFVAFREVYLIQYDITAIRLIFTYYEGPNGLILNGFEWDDQFDIEFD